MGSLLLHFSFTKIVFLLFLLFSSLPSHNAQNTSYCDSYRDPSYCRRVLPGTGGGGGAGVDRVRSYGRYSLRKTLYRSRVALEFVNSYLQDKVGLLPADVDGALSDCRQLLNLNVELLSTCVRTANKTDAILPELAAEDFQTKLSTVVTNLVTCSDGLSPHPEIKAELLRQGGLADDAKLNSLSLDICTKGWVPRRRRGGKWIPRSSGGWKPRGSGGGDGFRLRFSSEDTRRAYEAAARKNRRGRRMVENGDETVVVKNMVVVSQDGSWDYKNITAAVTAAPKNLNGSDGYFLIYITAGVYQEYVEVPSNKKYLFFLGDGINQTIITGNHSVGDNYTTFNSFTLAVTGQGFLGVDLTVRNTAGPSKSQAVALRNGADLSTFYRCSFEAYQDTLYTHSNRQFYRQCDIYGTVDFIFGNAAVVLQRCNVYPRLPLPGQFNAITAQGRTDPNQNTGTSIHNCTITPAADLAASNGTTKTYLGRPWKLYARTVVMQSYLDKFIQPAGWREWSTNSSVDPLYYAEFGNTGPGSNTTNRIKWSGYFRINATEALAFTVSTFLGGDSWLPATGVPYIGGLV